MVSPIVQNNDVPASTEGPIVTRTPTDPFANDPLRQIARNSGEPLVPLDTNVNKPLQKSETTLAANNVCEYQAQAGDTLSRIAALLPGGNTKANRDAVVKLNPVLQKDPNKVVSGRKYLLPTEVGVSTPAPVPAPLVQQPTLVQKTIDPKPAAKTEATTFRTYTVQKGDSLSKIAVEQLGSNSQIATIRELNQAVLKNSDVVRVDMKLKLPVNN
ncbi:MAG: LysM peptidoglycan-binding domain-containing protein [Burkholderiales bacterium]|nr:LysM peptidoglycan-binding domain-containing protein [Phycisphaerae bacterium]